MKKYLFILQVLFSLQLSAQWQPSIGTSGTSVISLTTDSTRCFAGTWGSGIFQSSDFGSSWTLSSTGLTNMFAFPIEIIGSNIYAGTYGGGIFLSTDTGNSWSGCNNGLTDTIIYAFASKGAKILSGLNGGSGGLFETSVGSCNWNYLHGMDVLALEFHDSDLYVGTCGAIYLSHDSGATYSFINNGLSDYCIWSLAFLGTNIFASTDTGGVLMSTDNGLSWVQVNNGLPSNFEIRSMAINGTDIFAVTAGAGVFLSSDTGNSWNAINVGLTTLDVRAISVSGANVIIGTWGGGAWIRPLADILSSVSDLKEASSFKLFPNPSKDSFTFTTDLQIENARLEVYNSIGKIIYSSKLTSKQHTINHNFLSGIYFVKASDNDKQFTVKLIVQ